jgi:hypothetical protein
MCRCSRAIARAFSGSLSNLVPVRHTAQARQVLGDGPFLGLEHAVLWLCSLWIRATLDTRR